MIDRSTSGQRLGPPAWPACLLVAVLGTAALAGQVGWSRIAVGAVGGTLAAASLTLSGAMAGLSAGAALGRAAAGRLPPRLALGLLLSGCALALGAAPALLLGLQRVEGLPVLRLSLAAGVFALAHLPFGAALPVAAAWRGGRAEDGDLYAAGAAGAFAGAVGSGGLLADSMPLDGAGWTLSGVVLGLLLFVAVPTASRPPRLAPRPDGQADPRGGVAVAFVLGFLGLAAELFWMRVLGFYWESSPATFAWVAAAQVGGSALGAWLGWRARAGSGGPLVGVLCSVAAVLAAASLAAPWAREIRSDGLRLAAAIGLVGIPAGGSGAAFAVLLRRSAGSGAPGRAIGLLTCSNAAGSALAPLLLWLAADHLPWMLQGLCAMAAGYGLLAAAASPGLRGRAMALAVTAGAAVTALFPSGPSVHDFGVPEDPATGGDLEARVLPFVHTGLGATVTVSRDTGSGIEMLWIDRGHQGDTTAPGRLLYERLGSLPGRLAGRPPRRALMIGLGTGISLSALVDGGVGRVDVAELVEGVIRANRLLLADANRHVLDRPEVRPLHADGRTVLADAVEPYDLIVANMVFPSVSGAGTLFSREFYALCRRRLSADGVFVQWISCLQFGPEDLRGVVAAFRESFPDGTAWIGALGVERIVLGLVGGRISESIPPEVSASLALPPRGLERLASGAVAVRDADSRIEHRTSRLQPDRESAERMLRWIVEEMRAARDGGASSAGAWEEVARGSLFERDGYDEAARAAYEEASRRAPGATDAEFRRSASAYREHLKDAGIAARRGDAESALGHLRRAAAHPGFIQGRLALADLLAALGRRREALEELHRAGSSAPRSADIQARISVLAASLGDGRLARSALQTACALRTDRPPLYLRLDQQLRAVFPAGP